MQKLTAEYKQQRKIEYICMGNYVEHQLIQAFRHYDTVENQMRKNIKEKGIRNCGLNLNFAYKLGVKEDEDLVDFFLALRRREFLQNDIVNLKERVAIRNQRYAEHGDKTIDPVIDLFIRYFHSWGYSQNAIAEATGVSQTSVCKRAQEEKQEVRKRSQIVELLDSPKDFNFEKWVVDEDNERTGPYLTLEQRKWIQELRDKGRTQAMICRKTGFSPRAVARWYHAPNIE
jgi:hypothetical protein|nr:hypothetical protein [uncultured Lachnoclostridium sp.]